MNIVERNFYKLLRAGAYGTEEQIEPLSAWKWNRLYQLSMMHAVAHILYKGIEHCQDQFFVQVPKATLELWSQADNNDDSEGYDLLMSNRRTNPLLNHRLQDILDSEDSNIETRTALLHLVGIARFIMNAGIPVKRATEFGCFLREKNSYIDFMKLKEWTKSLEIDAMVQITAILLVKLLHFVPEELPFMQPTTDDKMERQGREMLRQKNSHAEQWYFEQGKNIFVHTSNSQAMLWHVRRSAKFFKYYPAETLTNFITSFAHSLSHIEE